MGRLKRNLHRVLHNSLEVYSAWRLGGTMSARAFSNRPPEAFPPHWADLAYLYRVVSKYRPKTVVELGSGCSTSILAEAVSQYGGRLYSYEAEPQWLEVTRHSMATPSASSVILRPCRAVATTVNGSRAWVHEAEWPQEQIDFLYLDSPKLVNGIHIAADPWLLQERFSPDALLLVDGRHENVAWLKQNLDHHWRVRRNRVLNSTLFRRRARAAGVITSRYRPLV
jgi:predicted O-methyltransferase YrrM